MPRKFRKRKSRPRRRRRKAFISRSPISNTALVKMPYSQIITLDPGVAGITDYNIFRANSIFDPDYTGVGHQPKSRDLYGSIYGKYTVLGSKLTATFLPNGSPYVVGVGLNEASTTVPPSSSEELLEDPQYNTRVMNFAADKNVVVTKMYSAKKFHGVRDILGNPNHGADYGSNPVIDPGFAVVCGPADNSSNSPSIQVHIQLSYIVRLSDRLQLGQS